jgi:hypothetical protein
MSLFPKGTIDAMKNQREQAMNDTFKAWTTEADESTSDPYDSTETVHYDGKASITGDLVAFTRGEDGTEALDADATAVLPLVGAGVEDAMLDARCEGTFRGQTREGRVVETRRREVTVAVAVRWD